MGILDDAIREHLELIRQHGADDSEVQRLEDEAFGPPTRPDEADFPDSEEGAAANGNGVATEAAVEEPSPEEAAAHEDVTTLMPAPDAPAPETGEEDFEPGSGLEEPTGAHIASEPESEDMLIEPAEEPVAEVEEIEPAVEEHSILEEPAASEPAAQEPVAEEPLAEEAAPEERTSLYDHSRDGVDLDLSLEEEPAAEAPSEEHDVAEPEEHDVAEPEGATPLEPPIESLDTVEHPFHEEIVEDEPLEEAAPSDEYQVEEAAPPAPEEAQPHEEGEEGDDEDVLADTPEFLKDAPEDDELWFEQGEPKDFDF